MEIGIYSVAAIAGILLSAALLVVWSRRDISLLRGLAIPLALAATSIATGIVGNTLGNAVPLIGGITAPAGDATVLSVKAIENQGIYITFDTPGAPKLFWMPWNASTAKDLQDMIEDPGNAGVTATIPPFEFSWDRKPPTFQPLPQPKWMPDKPEQDQKPQAPHFSA